MRKDNWYFTIVSHGETAIEYAVVCIDKDFDATTRRMQEAWMGIITDLGVEFTPTICVPLKHVALVKTLPCCDDEQLEENIDASDSMWVPLPLRPIHALLMESEELPREAVLELLQESAVSDSSARLCMEGPSNLYIHISPGDTHETINTYPFPLNLLNTHNN